MNYAMYRGDSLVLDVLVSQSVDGVLAPVDLTGATLWMTAKKKMRDADTIAVFQVKTPDDILIDGDPTSGRARITVPASATTSLVFQADSVQLELFFDVQVKTQTGLVQTVVTGKLIVMEDVTDAIT